MKLSLITLVIVGAAAQEDTFTVGSKAKQKVNHLKKNGPILLDLFFGPGANPSKPPQAAKFVLKTKERLSRFHERLVAAWGRCGSASKDATFDPRISLDPKFDHFDVFKGITGLTNGYKQFIEAQINPYCKKQGENSNFLNRIKLWAGIWKFKYCALVNPSYAGCADTKHHSNPKDDGRNPFTQD